MSKEVLDYWEAQGNRVTRAEDVLDIHRKLQGSMKLDLVRKYVASFMKSINKTAYEAGGSQEVLRAMANLFYPATDEKQLCPLLGKELFLARTYQVTGEMVEAVTGTYRNSAKSVGFLQEEELPSEAGFVWLDKPFLSTDSRGKTVATRAVSWSPQSVTYADRTEAGAVIYPGIRLSAWFFPSDHDDYADGDVRKFGQDRGIPMLLSHTSVLPFGQRFGGHPKDDFDMTPDDFAHWVHVLWCFMETEITTNRQAQIPRPARRRAENWRKAPPAVNVITLRRIVADGVDPEETVHRQIDWSCRWVVQGHYRHLDAYTETKHHATPNGSDREHCAICRSRITWVKPHLRGPEGLPLRSVEQLYRLSR